MLQSVQSHTAFYLLLLQDVFQYMDNYKYEDGMKHLIDEMDALLSDKTVGVPKGRALLLDCRAMMEKSPKKAIKLMEDALAFLPEVTTDNPLLVPNLNANLGTMYHDEGQNMDARRYMEAAVHILEQFGLIGCHDSLLQFINYAVILNDTGEPECGLDGLRKLEGVVREINPDSGDYALILETTGALYLAQGDAAQTTEYFKRALSIYQVIWASEPQLIGEKCQEIQEYYQMANVAVPPGFLLTNGQ